MVEIKEVKTKKQIKEFINFPLDLYKGNEYFVPPLYGDEKNIFKKDFAYSDQTECIYYNAYKNDKIVGRISGIIQLASNKKNNEKRVRFTRFDAINDQEVADRLFSAVEKWAKDKGMNTIVGPLGFSDLEREGLLVEGFDQISTFEEQYNYEYYQTLIENYGFVKEVDWLESKLYLPDDYKEKLERLDRLSSLMMKRYNLKFGESKNTNEFIKQYAEQFFNILDETYDKLYGTVPFTDKTRKMMISNFKLIINVKNVAVIVDENDKVVCFGICFPSLGKAVQKSKGHLTPSALIRLLKAIKKPKVIDLGLIGVLPEYQNKGIASAIVAKVMKMLAYDGIEYAETNLNLEDNKNIQNQWKVFNAIQHKRRRAYVKPIL